MQSNPPTFVNPPLDIIAKVREKTEWDLPEINDGSLSGTVLTVEIDEAIQEFLKYDNETLKFTFDGENEGTYPLVGSSFEIKLTLTNIIEDFTSYIQNVAI